MNAFLKFGSRGIELDRVTSRIADVMKLEFESRESSYWGGDYFLSRSDERKWRTIKVHPNSDVYDEQPIFPEFAKYDVLIHCDYAVDENCLLSTFRTRGFELIYRSTSQR